MMGVKVNCLAIVSHDLSQLQLGVYHSFGSTQFSLVDFDLLISFFGSQKC